MTQAELAQTLKSLGMPVAYGGFKKKITPPFITYQFAYSSNVMTDNQNYIDIENFQVELYTKDKDPVAEKLVQDKLKELKLPYGKAESFLDSEDLLQIVYEIQLIGG